MSERIEKIMKEYPRMVMERKCLEGQITHFVGVKENDVIDSVQYSRHQGERVQTSSVSDKTSCITLSYMEKVERINRDWIEHLQKKYLLLSEEINFFESAVLSLSGNLPEFITDMIMNGMTWDELAVKYHVCRTMVAKYRKNAIRQLENIYAIYDDEMVTYILS